MFIIEVALQMTAIFGEIGATSGFWGMLALLSGHKTCQGNR